MLERKFHARKKKKELKVSKFHSAVSFSAHLECEQKFTFTSNALYSLEALPASRRLQSAADVLALRVHDAVILRACAACRCALRRRAAAAAVAPLAHFLCAPEERRRPPRRRTCARRAAARGRRRRISSAPAKHRHTTIQTSSKKFGKKSPPRGSHVQTVYRYRNHNIVFTLSTPRVVCSVYPRDWKYSYLGKEFVR